MGRPKASKKQRLRAWQLYRQDPPFGPKAIHDAIKEEFEDIEEPVSLKTVKNWLVEFRGTDEKDKWLDGPFQLHRMEEYGLPWEASAYLLEMWKVVQEGGVIEFDNFYRPPPTVRQVRWWWRVHLAVPDVHMLDVWYFAQRFVTRELFNEVLGEPLVMADLEAHLAYKPWASKEERQVYLQAIERELIQPIQHQAVHNVGRVAHASRDESAFMFTLVSEGFTSEYSELLPSQQQALLIQKFKNGGE